MAAVVLCGWVALAAWFGYSQFQRSLKWDESEVRAKERATASTRLRAWMELIYGLPSRLLKDPLGALVEKDVRTLARSPRFRLLFFMGCSIGLVIWVPLLLGRAGGHPGRGEHVLVVAGLYSTLLLGEILFWNQFWLRPQRGAGLLHHAAQLPLRAAGEESDGAVFPDAGAGRADAGD